MRVAQEEKGAGGNLFTVVVFQNILGEAAAAEFTESGERQRKSRRNSRHPYKNYMSLIRRHTELGVCWMRGGMGWGPGRQAGR